MLATTTMRIRGVLGLFDFVSTANILEIERHLSTLKIIKFSEIYINVYFLKKTNDFLEIFIQQSNMYILEKEKTINVYNKFSKEGINFFFRAREEK